MRQPSCSSANFPPFHASQEMYPLWVKMETHESKTGSSELPADVVALRVILDLAQRPGGTYRGGP